MESLRPIGIDVEVHRAIERARLSLDESENEILRRLLISPRPDGRRARRPGRGARPHGAESRRRGLWTVEIQGHKRPAANLKDAYRELLCVLGAVYPHFLEAFGEEKARGRRFIARSPSALYERSPHLARDHAEALADGWYFDSNLSAEQVARRARIAARLCGLHYGSEVRIVDNLREI